MNKSEYKIRNAGDRTEENITFGCKMRTCMSKYRAHSFENLHFINIMLGM